mgnify:FL=1|jgi:hypothetical protein
MNSIKPRTSKTDSPFRRFCYDKWYEHLDEKYVWEKSLPAYGSEYYFSQNKWNLKQMFIEAYAKQNHLKIQKSIKRNLKKGNL